ncbi:MAG: twin-arginine translocase subunit TatC [Candidatus Nitrospinota bacterium M3_3B_026]
MSEKETGEAKEAEEKTEDPYAKSGTRRRVGPEDRLPFTAHLEELRWRLIYGLATVAAAFAALYFVSDGLFQLLRRPMGMGQDLVFIAPAEAFFVYLKISLYGAIIISMPMILYQAWEFVAPGLLDVERRYTGVFVVLGSIFFIVGASFCYFVVLPLGLDFLLNFGGEGLSPMISVGNYISFVFKISIAFGITFELPIVLVFLVKLGVVTPETLAGKRPYFIVGSFVFASLLTPPDVFTQVVMAVPMILLYEVSILAARFFVHPAALEEADGE